MAYLRYAILIACLLALSIDYITRLNINIAIVSMVEPQYVQVQSTSKNRTVSIDKCGHRDLLVNNSNEISSSSNYDHGHDRFDWTPSQQGFVLGGFFYPYMLMQVPAGRLIELIGGKWVITGGVLISGLINLFTPLIAVNFAAIVLSRVALGIAQGGIYAAAYDLVCKWFPTHERAMALGSLETGTRIGTVVATYLSGYLADNYGWPWVFYVCGAIACGSFVILAPFLTSHPEQHRLITAQELELIHGMSIDDMTQLKQQTKRSVPWKSILTSPRVIGFVLSRCLLNYALYFVMTKLPAYLSDILRLSSTNVGVLSAVFAATSAIVFTLSGIASQVVISRKWLGITATRKVFFCIDSLGIAVATLLVPLAGCNHFACVGLLIAAHAFIGFGGGADAPLPRELSNNYATTIFALGNTGASLMGVLTPEIVGLVLEAGSDLDFQWQVNFYITAGVTAVSALLFCGLTSAERETWDIKP